ncbi:putative cell wall binding protein [Lachnospiraceae bacterium JC7]|nr:putative cell wall binding protein [Lachnospiraceae bacterium JC7]
MWKRFIFGLIAMLAASFSVTSYALEWQKDGAGWKLLDNRGSVCMEEWFYESGKQYYLDASGHMATGWNLIGDSWYYFEPDGSLVMDRWIEDKYVDYSGKMLTNTRTKDGNYVGADGIRVSKYEAVKPIEIKYMRAHMTKDGWISPNIYFINSSGKTISSMTFTVTPYNAAHDIVFCDVTGCSTTDKMVSGPFYPDDADVCGKYILSSDGTVTQADPNSVADYGKTFDNCVALDKIWHGGNISTYAIVGIKIQYLDGTWETVDPYNVIKQSY